MKALLWVMLIVQALAFVVGLALQGEPVIPGTPGGLHAVGTLTDKFLALLGLLATLALCSLFASLDRSARLFGLGMGAAALLIAWLLLQASPFGLSLTIAVIAAVTFGLLVVALVQDRTSEEEVGDDEADETVEPQSYPRVSVPLEGYGSSEAQPYRRVSAPLEGYGMREPQTEKRFPVPPAAASGWSAPHTIPPFSVRLQGAPRSSDRPPNEKSEPA